MKGSQAVLNSQIRLASPKDIPIILIMIKELADYQEIGNEVEATYKVLYKNLFEGLNTPEVLIAEENGYPVGMCIFFHNFCSILGKKGIYIEDLYVREEYRKNGHGIAMIREICKIFKSRDCGRIEWLVLNANQNAIDFYKQIGANPVNDWKVFRLTEKSINEFLEEEAIG